MDKSEIKLIRDLANQYTELSNLDVNTERYNRCRDINDCIPNKRPPVWIDEIPWHEMDIDNQLRLECADPFARNMEWFFKSNLFRWKYIQADMVLPNYYTVGKKSTSSGIGISVNEETLSTDGKNHIVSHQYEDELDTDEKLEKLHNPVITAYPEDDKKNVEVAEEILHGILPVKLKGGSIYHSPWDQISTLRGVEPCLFDMIDRPEFIHKTMQKFTDIGLSQMQQMEDLNLLDYDINSLHCTPPYTKSLPSKEYDANKTLLTDVWFRAMAQMLTTVSPDAFDEFEAQYVKILAAKCGLTYYGCCEPLDNVIGKLKQIPNLRKLGVSPWSNVRRCAEQIGSDFTFARKPNPAAVAIKVDEKALREEISETIIICKEYNCAYEFVLKDISTVGHDPQNLITWNKIVQETIDEHYK